jgi:hypothetical protein
MAIIKYAAIKNQILSEKSTAHPRRRDITRHPSPEKMLPHVSTYHSKTTHIHLSQYTHPTVFIIRNSDYSHRSMHTPNPAADSQQQRRPRELNQQHNRPAEDKTGPR